MRIESGPTTERCVRLGIFLAMCTVFMILFIKDGFWSYKAENMQQIRDNIPGVHDDIQLNPEVTVDKFKAIEHGTPVEQLRAEMGDPSHTSPAEYVYVGTERMITIRFDEKGRVEGEPMEAPRPEEVEGFEPTTKITQQRLALVKPGATPESVTNILGEPYDSKNTVFYYIGPDAFGHVELFGGVVVAPLPQPQLFAHSEADIQLQKAIAIALILVFIVTVINFVRAIRVRVVLDETGLTYNGKLVKWEEMKALKIDDYRRKGYVDLVYGDDQMLRLDCYHFAEFKPIIREICDRKGFELPPFRKPEDAKSDELAKDIDNATNQDSKSDTTET